jgi:hypothetical protein
MAHPLVSVIVPSFNRLEWLPTAVLSVQAQTLPDWELVLIDGKAAHTMPDRRLRQIARRQLRADLGTFLRRALRHGAVGEMVRVAGVFTRW